MARWALGTDLYCARPNHLDSGFVTERDWILALTRVAFLDAVVFSFLSIQFVMPPTFVILLWVVPTVFALQAYHVPLRLTGSSGVLVVLMSSVVFGIAIGIWTWIYFMAGCVLGVGRRYHLPLVLRLLTTAMTFATCLFASVIVFGWLANISWQEISAALVLLPAPDQIPILPCMIVGLALWSMLLSLGTESSLARILRHLHIGLR
jgi:hypothetical protein